VLHAAGDVVVYLRWNGDERIVVALNRGQSPCALNLDLSADLSGAPALRELLAGGETRLQNGVLESSLPPQSAAVWLALNA